MRAWFVLLSGALAGCSADPAESHLGTGGGAGGSAGSVTSASASAAAGGEGGGCVEPWPIESEPPALLSQTGLYDDIAAHEVAAGARPFTPRHALWSDGTDKQRWVYLPACGIIDATDPDDWSLPVGTRLWKELSLDGRRIETRLLARVGPGPHDFRFTAYLWNDIETDATRVPEGVPDANGTGHDVPSEVACRRCHGSHAGGGGRPSRALGLSAVQLAHDGPGLTLATLAEEGKLSPVPESTTLPTVGDDELTRAALGYLHANCGSCHNRTVDAVPQVDLDLWLGVGEEAFEQTGVFLTAIDIPTTVFSDQHVTARIAPGAPEASAVWFRMQERGNNGQMPPLASNRVDEFGANLLASWIEALP